MPTQTPAKTADAITAARFSITIDGSEIAAFSELLAIRSEVEPAEVHQIVDKEAVIRTSPGRRLTPTVVLKRGKTANMELWAWHEAVVLGNMAAARKSCSLVMYNSEGMPVARYHLTDAWPSKIEIGAFKAGASEVLMETVTLVCEEIQRVAP